MLPHALSSDACSLMPGVERAAVTVELELDGARSCSVRLLPLADPLGRAPGLRARGPHLRGRRARPGALGRAAARGSRAARPRSQDRREQSGALVVESEEPEFSLRRAGQRQRDPRRAAQTESHRLIEHLMIAANEAVAGLLAQRGVPCLFRVHERPEPERIERLVDQLASLEVPTPPLPEPMSATQAADLVGEISRLVDGHVRRTGRGRMALSSLVLRSLKQAYYSPRNLGHAGLHSAELLPLHLADPPLSRPRLPPCAALGGGRAGSAAARRASWSSWARGPPNASARRRRSSATATTSRAASARAAAARAGPRAASSRARSPG